MNINKRLATAIATGAILLNALTPMAFAATTITISGNGLNSDNEVNVSMGQTTTVVQENNANVNNFVSANANSGGNDANGNTGGDVDITTGEAKVDVSVSTMVNKNVANVDCCDTGDTTVKISENGKNSDNKVDLDSEKSIGVFQNNDAFVFNTVYGNANSGNNDANGNTGGDVSITAGKASVEVDVDNKANANFAQVGGNSDGADLNLWIVGNGENSDNEIDLDLASQILLVQENEAFIDNFVSANANSGGNDANGNTGGDVDITTKKATAEVDVDNMVNFNWADVDCDCIVDDLTVKVAQNGKDSDNSIDAEIGEALEVFQDNCADGQEWWWFDPGCNLINTAFADADSGENDANGNTGDPDGDPTVDAGNAEATVDLENSGNVNLFGVEPVDLPDFDFGLDLDISIDLGDLLDFLGLV